MKKVSSNKRSYSIEPKKLIVIFVEGKTEANYFNLLIRYLNFDKNKFRFKVIEVGNGWLHAKKPTDNIEKLKQRVLNEKDADYYYEADMENSSKAFHNFNNLKVHHKNIFTINGNFEYWLCQHYSEFDFSKTNYTNNELVKKFEEYSKTKKSNSAYSDYLCHKKIDEKKFISMVKIALRRKQKNLESTSLNFTNIDSLVKVLEKYSETK